MHGRDERVGAKLKYIDSQTFDETFGGYVEVAHNHVALPPTHQVDGVGVHPHHEQGHGSPHAERACADV